MKLLALIFMRDVALAVRRGGGAWNAPLFFILCMVFFAFALGADAIKSFAVPAACIAVFLSTLLATSNLFEADREDGTDEQYMLLPMAFEWVVLAKLLAGWMSQLLPMVLIAPLAAQLMGAGEVGAMLAALLPASLSLLAIAAFASALTMGVRKAAFVQALIALPFYVPVLIFAAAEASGQGGTAAMPMLWGLVLLLLPLSCIASAALLKIAQE